MNKKLIVVQIISLIFLLVFISLFILMNMLSNSCKLDFDMLSFKQANDSKKACYVRTIDSDDILGLEKTFIVNQMGDPEAVNKQDPHMFYILLVNDGGWFFIHLF